MTRHEKTLINRFIISLINEKTRKLVNLGKGKEYTMVVPVAAIFDKWGKLRKQLEK